jgi:hypothetical protein
MWPIPRLTSVLSHLFRKEKNNLKRERDYLNNAVEEQITEIKKLNMHKDERAVAALIRTY